jgi:hypothetical protein
MAKQAKPLFGGCLRSRPRVNEIRRDIAQSFGLAVRPANRNFLHLSICRQPRVQPQIVLRNVTRAAAHFIEQR